jgi:hypothetical protein
MDMMHAMRFIHHWAPTGDHIFEYSCAPTAVTFATHNISYSTSCIRGSEVLKISFKPTAVTAGGTSLKPRHEVRGTGSYNNGDSTPVDAESWYDYDSETGLLTVSHVAHGDIVVV